PHICSFLSRNSAARSGCKALFRAAAVRRRYRTRRRNLCREREVLATLKITNRAFTLGELVVCRLCPLTSETAQNGVNPKSSLSAEDNFQTFPQSALSSFLKPCRAYRKRILWSLLAKSLFRMPRRKGRRPLYLQDTYPRRWLPNRGHPSPNPSPVPIPSRRKKYSPLVSAGLKI